MSLKTLGSIMVVVSSSAIGFIIASFYHERPIILRNLQVALSMLETEMNYGLKPLPSALKSVENKCENQLSRLFYITRKYLVSKKYTVSEAWEMAVNEFYKDYNLSDSDIDILISFGKYLGSTSKEDQIRNIKLTLSNLKQQEIIAIKEREKNEKLWRYLGVLSGIMIFLLLY